MKPIRILNLLILSSLLFGLINAFPAFTLRLCAEEIDPYAPYIDGTPEGCMLIEGDILIPKYSPRASYDSYLWPNGVVPYRFDSNVSATNQTRMLDAMAEWEAVANVQFVVRSTQSDYLHIQNSTINSSFVGVHGGQQVVNIASWTRRFIIAHELAHALGFWHEQSRSDRDTYVTVHWSRIADRCGDTGTESCDYNFYLKHTADVYPPDEYDFDSVMHYGQCAFSNCANCAANPAVCRTIEIHPPWDTPWQNAIGQRDHLSRFDEMTMSFLYPESDWVFVDQAYTGAVQIGTFQRPYRLFDNGAGAVSAGGTVVIQPGDYSAGGVYTKAMTLRAPLGDVVLAD